MSVTLRGLQAQQTLREIATTDEPVAGRPRVCFVGFSNLAVLAPEYNRAGAAGEPVQQTLLAKALARRGYSISMVTADHGQPDGATWHGVRTFKAFARDAGLPLWRFVHPRWTGLWSALKRADADVYYVSCAGAIVGQVAMFCALHGKRFVFRIVSVADCARDTLIVKYWRDRWLYEYGLRRASGVLAQSVQQQRLLEQNFRVRSSLADLMVEPSRADIGFHDRDIDVLWVSNVRKLKRPDILLNVAASLPNLSFHMAGGPVSGEQSCFEDTKARAFGRHNVSFHGPVPYRDVGALYSRARVLVNTSDIEGFPNTYLQAWTSGTPVVAFFDPDGVIAREGLGAAVHTQDEMAKAVQRLVRDESAWKAASARCLAFARREYDDDKVLQPYLRLIDPRRGDA